MWRVCKSCFLKELSIIALPADPIELLIEAPVPFTCASCVPSTRSSPPLRKGAAPTHFHTLRTAGFSVFWPGILQPRQLINDFHSGCLRAVLIILVAQSNEESCWWPKCKPGLAPTAWTGKSEYQRAAVLSKISWKWMLRGSCHHQLMQPAFQISTCVCVCVHSFRGKEHLPRWKPDVSEDVQCLGRCCLTASLRFVPSWVANKGYWFHCCCWGTSSG